MADRVRSIEVSVADVTLKTRWVFLEVTTEAGWRGAGEATLTGQEVAVVDAVRRFAPAVFALEVADPARLSRPELRSLPEAAAFSALDQALWDIVARRRGTTVAQALGSIRREGVPLYANINRRTLDRSPSGFAASARDALVAGHEWFKIAPFDEATPEARRAGTLLDAVEPGLARARAVREAVGPGRRLMLDCHWRLDVASAERVIDAASEIGVHWVECPLPEDDAHMQHLVRLRGRANGRGVAMAGLELEIGRAGFEPFIAAGAYDVMMPDAKYVGGLTEMLRLAERMAQAGIAFSPHNPTGPVCHAVSLQLCAVVDRLHSLETQYDETPTFAALAGASLQEVEGGVTALPAAPGIGMALQQDVLAGCRSTHWVGTREAA